MENCAKLSQIYSNMHGHYSCVFFFPFMYPNDKEREWMIFVMCKERQAIKKYQENFIF